MRGVLPRESSKLGICASVQEERDGLVASIRSSVVQSRRALLVLMVHTSAVAEKDLERGGGADLCGFFQIHGYQGDGLCSRQAQGFQFSIFTLMQSSCPILVPRVRSKSTVSGVRPQ